MQNSYSVPRTGLEPARLSTLAPETSASTIPPPGQLPLSGKRGSNSRPQPWQGCALPTELFPRFCEFSLQYHISLPRLETLLFCGKVVLYQLSYFRVSAKLGIFCYAFCVKLLLHSLARKFRIYTQCFVLQTKIHNFKESGKRGSNSRPQPWQGCALPTELFPRFCEFSL